MEIPNKFSLRLYLVLAYAYVLTVILCISRRNNDDCTYTDHVGDNRSL